MGLLGKLKGKRDEDDDDDLDGLDEESLDDDQGPSSGFRDIARDGPRRGLCHEASRALRG